MTTIPLPVRAEEMEAVAEHLHQRCHNQCEEVIAQDLVTVLLLRVYLRWREETAEGLN